jgi:CRISPR-associated RAMP protein (TIGR02581 family)
MMRKWLCQADVTVRLEPKDPVLIKSGYATIDGPDMVPVSTFRNGEKVYYFPGSSLKGALRSHFERIARTLKEASVCLPYYDPKKVEDIPVPAPAEANSFGCGYRGADDSMKSEYYRDACAACRLFGSLRYGGRFSIGDAYPIPGHEPRPSQRNGVGIDRFTGGTVRGVLFDVLVLEGGLFEAQVRVLNFELWQLAALNFLLLDLRDEMITIGSGRSRGLGRVRGEVTHYALSYVRPQTELRGLAELATKEDRDAYGLFAWAAAEPISLPAAERRGLRHQYNLSADWASRLEPLAPSLDGFLQAHGGPRGAVVPRAAERG